MKTLKGKTPQRIMAEICELLGVVELPPPNSPRGFIVTVTAEAVQFDQCEQFIANCRKVVTHLAAKGNGDVAVALRIPDMEWETYTVAKLQFFHGIHSGD